jgi:glutathione synthase/RimK-type ligase-like ATP-grasp enzyme
MNKKKKNTTILSIGDWGDYDSYKKLNKEKRFINEQGFKYKTVEYSPFLDAQLPEIDTEKVIIFTFFPFVYWDHHIEHRGYKGIYGNVTFYKKFTRFCHEAVDIIKSSLSEKEILFINNPALSAYYRDKILVMDALAKKGVATPPVLKTRRVKDINAMLEKGQKLYIKPRCGSMGKGITFLQLGDWQTNFGFRSEKIVSRKSDYGWKFHDVTGNSTFLSNLLKKHISIEGAIEPLNIKGDKVDFRVYTFLDKVLYVYPRRNHIDSVTTNISQGGWGDPSLLEVIPERLLSKIKRTAVQATKALGLDFTGSDVVVDNNLKDVYVVDVNMFPGFPKRRTHNLARDMVVRLKQLDRKGTLRYKKATDIEL